MKTGKISDNVLKRSVLREIKHHRDEVSKGADVGLDCALLLSEATAKVAVCTDTGLAGIPDYQDMISISVQNVIGNLVASFAAPSAIFANVILPEDAEEDLLKDMMRALEQAAGLWNVQVAGGHTEVSRAVKEPLITLTGVGALEEHQQEKSGKTKTIADFKKAVQGDNAPFLDLVVTNHVGLEGTILLAKNGKKSLLTRYPEKLIEDAIDFSNYLTLLPEAAHAAMSGVCKMHDISRGGIFGALWELAMAAGAGLDVDLKKIPIRQETVEICNHFAVNPYELLSGGSFLMVAEDGSMVVDSLEEMGIPAAVIGHLTCGNDKIIRNGEDVRFLDRPKQDEIYRFLGGTEWWN